MSSREAVPEDALHKFWQGHSWLDAPRAAVDGTTVRILQRGEYNRDAGPDFRNAVVRIGSKIRAGDVELHVRPEDWYRHRHHLDPGYNRVVLHASLKSRGPAERVRCENGIEVPQLLLPDALVCKAASRALAATLPLLECPLREEDSQTQAAVIAAAGRERSQQFSSRFGEQLPYTSWDQLLYTGICGALGYAKNEQPFRHLARILPIELLLSEMRSAHRTPPEELVAAMLFGAAGFLSRSATRMSSGSAAAYAYSLGEIWQPLKHSLQLRELPVEAWRFFRLRPQNFPTRRLAGLAVLVSRFHREGMLETMAGSLLQPRSARARNAELRRCLTAEPWGFWREQDDFRRPGAFTLPTRGGALIGKGRANDLIVNVVLPLLRLYAKRTGQRALANRVDESLAAFPALQENVITRKMREQLDIPKSVAGAGGAFAQQGLIQLHKVYCVPLRCDSCLALRRPADTPARDI